MTRTEFYNGILYQIERVYSNCFYGQRTVYHIQTEQDNFCEAHRAIESIMEDGSWREGYYQFINKKQPSMLNGLHPYHEFTFDETLNKYIYTFIKPYDD